MSYRRSAYSWNYNQGRGEDYEHRALIRNDNHITDNSSGSSTPTGASRVFISSPQNMSARFFTTCTSCNKLVVSVIALPLLIMVAVAFGKLENPELTTSVMRHTPLVSQFFQTKEPTNTPTASPTPKPSRDPSVPPTRAPTKKPSDSPTPHPTLSPTPGAPTRAPTASFVGIWGDDPIYADSTLKAVTLESYPEALCLDGSPGMYYISSAITNNATGKYFIFLEDGSWCGGFNESLLVLNVSEDGYYNHTFETCLERSAGHLGSTNFDIVERKECENSTNTTNEKVARRRNATPEMVIDKAWRQKFGYGDTMSYFERNPNVNPLYWNWNIIFVRYCDGTSFSSSLHDAIKIVTSPSGTGNSSSEENEVFLHFRGFEILKAVFTDLIKNQNMAEATDIILAGQRSGAHAIYVHADYIYRHFLKKNIKNLNSFLTVMDNGFFTGPDDIQSKPTTTLQQDQDGDIEGNNDGSRPSTTSDQEPKSWLSPEFVELMTWIYVDTNASGLCKKCLSNSERYGVDCMYPASTLRYFTHNVGTFIVQSKFGHFQTCDILRICQLSKNFEELSKEQLSEVGKSVQESIFGNFNENGVHGVFMDACYHHDHYGSLYNSLVINNETQATALDTFWRSFVRNKSSEGDTSEAKIDSDESLWIQEENFPCEECCK